MKSLVCRTFQNSVWVRFARTHPLCGSVNRIVEVNRPRSVPALDLLCITLQPLVQQPSPFFHPAQAFVHVPQGSVYPPRSLCPPDPLGTQLHVSIAIADRYTSSFPQRYGPMGIVLYLLLWRLRRQSNKDAMKNMVRTVTTAPLLTPELAADVRAPSDAEDSSPRSPYG